MNDERNIKIDGTFDLWQSMLVELRAINDQLKIGNDQLRMENGGRVRAVEEGSSVDWQCPSCLDGRWRCRWEAGHKRDHEALVRWSPTADRPLASLYCTRSVGHKGPCNGWARKECMRMENDDPLPSSR